MIYVTAMAMLILSSPAVFDESREMRKENRLGFGGSPFSSEDLHRAFWLLKFHLRHVSVAKSENSFYNSTEDGEVRPMRYFTREQLEAAKTAKASGEVEGEEGDVHPMEQLARAEEAAPDLNDNDTRTFTEEEADFEKGVERLEELDAQSQGEVDPERSGIRLARPPLSRAAQRAFCERMAKKVKVRHEEEWMELKAGEDAEVRSQTIV